MIRITWDKGKFDKIIGKQRELSREAIGVVGQSLFEGVRDIIEPTTKQLAPVRTGALRDSIHTEKMDKTTTKLADNVHYGIFQELGFYHSSGKFIQHPFMIPAVESHLDDLVNKVENDLKKEIKK